MHKKSLDWLAGAASVDIFAYKDHKLQDLSTGDKHFNRGLMLKASKQAKSGLYTIVQYKSGYMVVNSDKRRNRLDFIAKNRY
ncbi:MAG: hypothetical protein ABF913_06870 [Oenococcus sp.]|uniref:hypothetical protein n=1 Tax=Oenococcus sp. TaxID=1979414 RepID=UPI0039E88109